MSAEVQGVFAIGCLGYDFIGDDDRSIEDAITSWNNDEQRKRLKMR